LHTPAAAAPLEKGPERHIYGQYRLLKQIVGDCMDNKIKAVKCNQEALASEIREIRGKYNNNRVVGAYLAAAIKRFKTARRLPLVRTITENENLDMTPSLARNLMWEFFASKPTSSILHSAFGTHGRAHGDRSVDNCEKRIAEIIARYADEAKKLDDLISKEVEESKK
jgi:hypothetical protein